MKIETKSNIGAFDYVISCEIGVELNPATTALCVRGLADTGFRGTASAVTSALVKAGVPCDAYQKGGKTVPAGAMTKDTPRGAILYSVATAEIVEESANEALGKLATEGKEEERIPLCLFKVTGEHQSAAPAASKEATAIYDAAIGADKLPALFTKLGLGDTADKPTVVAAIQKRLRDAAEAAKKAAMAF